MNSRPQQNPSELIKNKLDSFIARYHKVKLARGVLVMLGLVSATLILVSVLEYYGRFGTQTRTFLFFAFLLTTLWVTLQYLILPLLALFKLSKNRLNYTKAAHIVGNHFEEVSDKLLNVLQLQEHNKRENTHNELLIAAIEQKSQQLAPVPFIAAISLNDLVKAAKAALIPLIAVAIIAVFNAGVFTEGVQRVFNYNTHFAIPAPYSFVFNPPSKPLFKNQDYELVLKTKGKTLPQEMYIKLGDNLIKMQQTQKGTFVYTFKNLQNTRNFYFTDRNHNSSMYSLMVVAKPQITALSARVVFPDYMNKAPLDVYNTGNLSAPPGATITWQFASLETHDIVLQFGSDPIQRAQKLNANKFSYTLKVDKQTPYQVWAQNNTLEDADTLSFFIDLDSDKHPWLTHQKQQDSVALNTWYLFGDAQDDYGIKKLSLFYKVEGSDSNYNTVDWPADNSPSVHFFIPLNLNQIGVKPGQTLEYFFKVWDNDRVAGFKTYTSPIYTLERLSNQEVEEKIKESGNAMVSAMQNAMQKAAELRDQTQKIQQDLIQKPTLTWEDQQKLQELLDEQKKLENQINQIKEQNKKRNQMEDGIKQKSNELQRKQEQLEKLFEDLFDPETQELFKKIEDLLKERNKDPIREELNKLNKDNKNLDNMLDRALEQFKKLEIEKKVEEATQKLDELAKEQQNLKEQTEKSTKEESETLSQKQEELNQEFQNLRDDLREIEQKNQNLENPMDMSDTRNKEEQIQNQMDGALQDISKNKKKNASSKQQDASDKMQELAQQLKEDMQKQQSQQQEEDYHSLRVLLKNLVLLSESQEDLLTQFSELKGYNPQYVTLSKKQKELKQLSVMIEDSLLALAKRQPVIATYVTRETGSLVYQMDGAIAELSERRTAPAMVKQQYAMMHANNLAVFLTDVLQQMQEQMKESQSKDKKKNEGEPNAQCDNPGEGDLSKSKPKPGMEGMQQLQDRLNGMLEELQNGKKQGKMPSSEEFAKIAAQQEALRKELEKAEKSLKEQGMGGSELAKEMAKTKEMMEESEKQLYNKNLDPRLMQLQRDISHRLFEHEKAEREQGEDDKRKGETASHKQRTMPPSIEQYLKEKEKELEFYKTMPPEFTPYYRERVREYYRILQQTQVQ